GRGARRRAARRARPAADGARARAGRVPALPAGARQLAAQGRAVPAAADVPRGVRDVAARSGAGLVVTLRVQCGRPSAGRSWRSTPRSPGHPGDDAPRTPLRPGRRCATLVAVPAAPPRVRGDGSRTRGHSTAMTGIRTTA